MVHIGMAGEIVEVSGAALDVVSKLGSIGLWLQAVGVVIIVWLLFQIIIWWINHRRLKEIYTIKDDMKRIEEKIDKILTGIKKN